MNSLIPSAEGINFAPIAPLLQLGRDQPKVSNYLWEALRERATHYLNLQKETRREMLTSGEQVANFLSGKHFLMPSLYEPGRFIPYHLPNSNAQKRAINICQFYISNCLFKWLLSNPEVQVTPGIATDEAEQAAAGATIIADRYSKEFFKPRKVIEEGLQGICWGSYIWRVYPDVGKQIATAIREVLENRTIEMGDGFGQCTECDFAGKAKDFHQVTSPEGDVQANLCPECNGRADVEQPASRSVPTVIDQQKIPIFDLSAEIVPFTNALWDYQYTFDESPWAIIRKRTNKGVITALIGDVRIPDGKGGTDVGLDIAERLAYSGSANAGYSSSSNNSRSLYKNPITIDECFLSPGDYADIVLRDDVETVGGQIIPKGRLVDSFPEKLLMQGLNEWSAIFGLFKENHKKYTTQGVWYSKAMSGAGRGLNDLVEVNKILNADHAQIHNYLRSVSTPAMGIRVEALGDENRAKYVGTPGVNIPIISSNLPEDMRMDDIVRPLFQPQSVPGQMFDFTYNRTNELAQLMSHITDFSGGLPGVKNDTATGARITQANSNALFTPPLSVKKEVRQRIAEISVDLYCQYVPIERYFPLKGKYGRMQGVYLSGASIKKDWLAFEVTEDSELPRNSAIKRDDYTAFFGMFKGGFVDYAAAKEASPEIVQDMERAYGIKAEAEKYNVAETLCLQRVKQMAQVAQLTQNPQDLLLAINPPIDALEDNVETKIKWFRAWFDTNDGMEAPPQLRAAVGFVIRLYFQNLSDIQNAIAGAQGDAAAAAGAAPAIGQHLLSKDMAEHAAQVAPAQQGQPDTSAADAEEADKQREHELFQQILDQLHEMKMKQSQADPSETLGPLDYPDVPPTAQSAMLKRAGLPSGGTAAVHKATLDKMKIAAAKTKANKSAPKRRAA